MLSVSWDTAMSSDSKIGIKSKGCTDSNGLPIPCEFYIEPHVVPQKKEDLENRADESKDIDDD